MVASFFALMAIQAATPALETPAPPPTEISQATSVRLPALTPVQIVVLEDLSGKGAIAGQEFEIALAAPVVIDEKFVIPAGIRGRGWVVHADKPRFGGRPGELLLGARFLELGDIRIPLRSLKLGGVGKDNSNIAVALAVAGGAVGGVASMFVTGKDARVVTGLGATAKVAADVDLPVQALVPAEQVTVGLASTPPPLPTTTKE